MEIIYTDGLSKASLDKIRTADWTKRMFEMSDMFQIETLKLIALENLDLLETIWQHYNPTARRQWSRGSNPLFLNLSDRELISFYKLLTEELESINTNKQNTKNIITQLKKEVGFIIYTKMNQMVDSGKSGPSWAGPSDTFFRVLEQGTCCK